MITRETIARWLFPDIAKNAARYVTMRNQVNTEIWWLAEFPDVRDTLQRILETDRNYWRAPSDRYDADLPAGISNFREMLRLRNSPPDMVRMKEDLARAFDANSRQASCIRQCAAHIGPDTAGTIDGLPRAVKHLVEQLRQAREVVTDETVIAAIVDAVAEVMDDATVDYPAGREAGPRIDYDEEDLRQRVAKLLSQLVNKPDAAAIIKKIAQVSTAVGFQSGEPELEMAGQIVSVLAATPEHINRFMAQGSELFIDGTFNPENGSLTYRSAGGDILHPSVLRKPHA